MKALHAKVIICLACLLIGAIGMYNDVLGSGWVIFAGLMAAMSIMDHDDEDECCDCDRY